MVTKNSVFVVFNVLLITVAILAFQVGRLVGDKETWQSLTNSAVVVRVSKDASTYRTEQIGTDLPDIHWAVWNTNTAPGNAMQDAVMNTVKDWMSGTKMNTNQTREFKIITHDN